MVVQFVIHVKEREKNKPMCDSSRNIEERKEPKKKQKKKEIKKNILFIFFFPHISGCTWPGQMKWMLRATVVRFPNNIPSFYIIFFFHRAFISVIREGGEVWGGNARKRKKSKKPKIKQQQNGKKKWRKKHHQIVTSPCFIFPTFICCLLQFIHPFSLPWRSRFLTLYRADL